MIAAAGTFLFTQDLWVTVFWYSGWNETTCLILSTLGAAATSGIIYDTVQDIEKSFNVDEKVKLEEQAKLKEERSVYIDRQKIRISNKR
jgi:hypothetical protein